MLFVIDLTTDSGVLTTHHQLESVKLSLDMDYLEMFVISWGSEAAFLAGSPPAARWFIKRALASVDLSEGFLAGVQESVLASDTFSGATPTTDERSTLSAAKTRKRAELNAVALSRETGGFTVGDTRYESDARACNRILAAAIAARKAVVENQPFTRTWTAADGSVVTLNAVEMQSVAAGLEAHLADVQSTLQGLLASLQPLTTLAAVAAVAWP